MCLELCQTHMMELFPVPVQETADLVTFTEAILNVKLHFLRCENNEGNICHNAPGCRALNGLLSTQKFICLGVVRVTSNNTSLIGNCNSIDN